MVIACLPKWVPGFSNWVPCYPTWVPGIPKGGSFSILPDRAQVKILLVPLKRRAQIRWHPSKNNYILDFWPCERYVYMSFWKQCWCNSLCFKYKLSEIREVETLRHSQFLFLFAPCLNSMCILCKKIFLQHVNCNLRFPPPWKICRNHI